MTWERINKNYTVNFHNHILVSLYVGYDLSIYDLTSYFKWKAFKITIKLLKLIN